MSLIAARAGHSKGLCVWLGLRRSALPARVELFEDRAVALREMRRVLRKAGRVALSVWDRVETSLGYVRMIALLDRIFGKKVAETLLATFMFGEKSELQAVLAKGGM